MRVVSFRMLACFSDVVDLLHLAGQWPPVAWWGGTAAAAAVPQLASISCVQALEKQRTTQSSRPEVRPWAAAPPVTTAAGGSTPPPPLRSCIHSSLWSLLSPRRHALTLGLLLRCRGGAPWGPSARGGAPQQITPTAPKLCHLQHMQPLLRLQLPQMSLMPSPSRAMKAMHCLSIHLAQQHLRQPVHPAACIQGMYSQT